MTRNGMRFIFGILSGALAGTAIVAFLAQGGNSPEAAASALTNLGLAALWLYVPDTWEPPRWMMNLHRGMHLERVQNRLPFAAAVVAPIFLLVAIAKAVLSQESFNSIWLGFSGSFLVFAAAFIYVTRSQHRRHGSDLR